MDELLHDQVVLQFGCCSGCCSHVGLSSAVISAATHLLFWCLDQLFFILLLHLIIGYRRLLHKVTAATLNTITTMVIDIIFFILYRRMLEPGSTGLIMGLTTNQVMAHQTACEEDIFTMCDDNLLSASIFLPLPLLVELLLHVMFLFLCLGGHHALQLLRLC